MLHGFEGNHLCGPTFAFMALLTDRQFMISHLINAKQGTAIDWDLAVVEFGQILLFAKRLIEGCVELSGSPNLNRF